MPPVLSDVAAAFLDESRIARLATADREGQPHVVPLCYARKGEALYFVVDEKPKAPGRTLKRLENIAGNPRIALVVDRYDEDWTRLEYVLVRGRAALVEDADEYGRAVTLLRRRYPQYQAMRLAQARNPLVKIAISRVHHWRASGGTRA